jgi:hypothetical protein
MGVAKWSRRALEPYVLKIYSMHAPLRQRRGTLGLVETSSVNQDG